MHRLHTRCDKVLVLFAFFALAQASLASPVKAGQQGDKLFLENDDILSTWSVQGGTLRWPSFLNHDTGVALPLDTVFDLLPKEGRVLRSTDLKILAPPAIEEIPAAANSSKAADRLPGRQIRIELEDSSAKIRVTWKAVLREGANYLRQEVTIHALQEPFALTQIGLIDGLVPGAQVTGHVKGSPVTASGWFLGFEH